MTLSTQRLGMALIGAEWVLWLLVGMSVVSVTIIIERLIFYFRQSADLDPLVDEIRTLVARGEVEEARRRLAREPYLATRVVGKGLEVVDRGPDAVSEAM